MVSRVIPVPRFDLIIFGATGDLAKRKIFPALFHRFIAGQMPADARLIGVARSKLKVTEFRAFLATEIKKFAPDAVKKQKELTAFLQNVEYVAFDIHQNDHWENLVKMLRKHVIRAFYLSVAPSLFETISAKLNAYQINDENSRIIVEKPFGEDLLSAQKLNAALAKSFDERQIYRIDHYLGKETVQNLMALRFANILWEPLWNASYIDHVQITVAEKIGIEGRAPYYDKAGAMKDMVQNHLMQLLCLTAMEPPSHYTPDAVRDEKLKVIKALEPLAPNDIVRGQYTSANSDDRYTTHADNPESNTESFVALKAHVSNWRWKGVPFYLRTGKMMKSRMSEIVVVFKKPPHIMFPDLTDLRENLLTIRLQPNEGIDLQTVIKEPGLGGMRLAPVTLNMTFADSRLPQNDTQDAYERLMMDVIRGDQTLFMRKDEVEVAWQWTDPIIAHWKENYISPQKYQVGSAGPEDALMLIHKDGRKWQEIEE